ncbi:MAG TPA: hypothetical protein RMH99_06765 [Sandaracinaceae bacterium LLY-WYZ-13_1]|nr:hypothetical protein [Sandaracinaceae bacterium LLY-WYZ-13_1]
MSDATERPFEWLVQSGLGVRPELVRALVSTVHEGRSPDAARRAVLDRHRLGAAASGIWSGTRASLGSAAVASIMEHRSRLKRATETRAALALLDQPDLFDHPDWPRRALGLPAKRPWSRLLVREGLRFGARLAAIRLGRFAGDAASGAMGALLGGATGAGFNALEDGLEAHARRRDDRPPKQLPAALEPAFWSAEPSKPSSGGAF